MKNNKRKYEKLISRLGLNRVLIDEPLANYSSFRLGGPADLMYKASTHIELERSIQAAYSLGIPIFIMGGGTNLLISDQGFKGLVIKNETSRIQLIGVRGGNLLKNKDKITENSKIYLEVDAGIGVNRLVRYTLDQGFSGLEPFLGQPGSIGGAMWINAHNMSMGKYIGNTVYSAKIIELTGKIKKIPKSYFHFSYDFSILQNTSEIVLSVIFELSRGVKEKLWQEAQSVLEYRSQTQPHGVYSSGCTFRNISKSDAIRLATPKYTTSAGYLLESAGLKGKSIGGAMYSSHHTNFIIHKGEAKASDVSE